MGNDRTIWGSGNRIAAVMAPYVLLVAALNRWVLSSIRFPGSRVTMAAVGLVGVAAGVGTIVASYRAVSSALDRGELCTDGPYRFVRHPLYAAWIWLLLPGAALSLDMPLLLSASPVMYVVTRRFLPREEATLEAEFGDEYEAYRDEVNALVPTIGRR
jgi:protein-S-isoprenylcysteine O-methyltransferase Ste14